MKITNKFGLPENTTPEELETRFHYSKILTFGNRVLMAGYHYNGLNEDCYYEAVYEFTSQKHTCKDEIRLVKVSVGFFQDDGHAIKWAVTA